MSRQEILNVHTLELQVPIHCEGCLKKVKKVVQKIDGVCQSSVDATLGKVTVTGLMDPETVIMKIRKAGKPVWVWGMEPGTPVEVQLEMLQRGGTIDGGNSQQQANDVGAKDQQQQEPKDAGGKGKQQRQAKDTGGKGQGQLQQQPKGGAAGGGAAKDAKIVVPLPHQQPTPQPMPMAPFPAVQAAGAKDTRTVIFNHPGGDEFGDDDSSEFEDEFDELEDIDFEDDDISDGPATMTRPMGMPPCTAGGGNGGAKNSGGADLGGTMMRPLNMMGTGGGAGFPGVRRMGGEGRPLGGMPMGHPQMGGAGMQQSGSAGHSKPVGGMPMGMDLSKMGGAGMPKGGGFIHSKPAGSMPMCHPHIGGTGMQLGGSRVHGMPAAVLFPGGGSVMPVGQEMLPMSQFPPQQQQQMAAVMQQQQQQMLLNGHGHHHAHHGKHHGHHAHGGGHEYPLPWQQVASSYGYGYGRPPVPQYSPMPYYYSLPPQRHPHDNFFSDENPNGCSVM